MHKLLLDNNISHRLVARIDDLFPNSTHVSLVGLDEATDMQLYRYAKTHKFTIITKDSDFNDIILLKGFPPKIIWLKSGNCKIAEVERVLRQNHTAIVEFLMDSSSGVLEV